jgi:hypothetical protein
MNEGRLHRWTLLPKRQWLARSAQETPRNDAFGSPSWLVTGCLGISRDDLHLELRLPGTSQTVFAKWSVRNKVLRAPAFRALRDRRERPPHDYRAGTRQRRGRHALRAIRGRCPRPTRRRLQSQVANASTVMATLLFYRLDDAEVLPWVCVDGAIIRADMLWNARPVLKGALGRNSWH